jgi:hypothetical protein
MREVQAAAPGHQKLTANAGHPFENGYTQARPRNRLRGHKASGSAADDGDAMVRRMANWHALTF